MSGGGAFVREKIDGFAGVGEIHKFGHFALGEEGGAVGRILIKVEAGGSVVTPIDASLVVAAMHVEKEVEAAPATVVTHLR